ncbi:MAG: hypothetical protein ABR981_04975 [Candidatus Micrarchaeaceae archaeon]|jgi:hypothetical protein
MTITLSNRQLERLVDLSATALAQHAKVTQSPSELKESVAFVRLELRRMDENSDYIPNITTVIEKLGRGLIK